jgi:hypothetical protein
MCHEEEQAPIEQGAGEVQPLDVDVSATRSWSTRAQHLLFSYLNRISDRFYGHRLDIRR